MRDIVGRFKFFPVGQGLFYGGNISVNKRSIFSFVYDCGTEDRWSSYLDVAINSFSTFVNRHGPSEICHLDLAIISHFHEDHFVGMYKLIQKVGRPKMIILPLIFGDYLTKEICLFSLFANSNNNNDISIAVFRHFSRLYSKVNSLSDEFDGFNVDERVDNFDNTISYSIDSGCCSTSLFFNGEKIWKFDFVQGSIGKKNPVVLSKIKSDIRELLLRNDCESIEEYVSNNPNGFNEIKAIYIANGFTSGYSMNNSSTILLHYPVMPVCNFWLFYHRDFYCYDDCVPTLLTGDSKINKNQAIVLVVLIDEIEPCFLITQLPHHGSDINFASIKKYLWTYVVNGVCVVSYGNGNSYKHPGSTVLHSFSLNQLLKVDEHRCVQYEIWQR